MKSLVLFAATLPLLQAGPIEIINLGGFGGTSSIAYRIDNSGIVTGWASTPSDLTHAFVWRGGGPLTDLTSVGVSEAYAYGANGAGVIVGTTYSGGQAHGAIWSPGGAIDLGPNSYALDVNASGQVAGGNGHAFIYSNGKQQDLGTLPGGNWSSAYAINSAGEAAGYASVGGAFRAFLWTPQSGMKSLGTLGGSNSYATAINAAGQAAGHSSLASGYEHAFLASAGALADLGTLGGNSSYAYGINSAGAVVGYSSLAGESAQHAFVSYHGRMADLNTLIPADTGWVLEQAYGINDAGDIVGTGTFQGRQQAFLLDPISLPGDPAAVPEPSPAVLLAAGLALIAWGRLRFHR